MLDCIHQWCPDPESLSYEDCLLCRAIRKIRDFCPTCGGRRWTADMHYDPKGGEKPTYRNPCGTCNASGLVMLDPPNIAWGFYTLYMAAG